MPTSPANSFRRVTINGDSRAGFSLLEVLVTLAIIGLTATIVLPNIAHTLDSNADRRAAFHFERLALDLRAAAFRDEQSLTVVDSGQFQDDPDVEPRQAEIKLDDGWTYRLAGPLNISARGLCDPVDADLFYEGMARMRMHGATDCSFTWERIRS